jgi:hypothetical protein
MPSVRNNPDLELDNLNLCCMATLDAMCSQQNIQNQSMCCVATLDAMCSQLRISFAFIFFGCMATLDAMCSQQIHYQYCIKILMTLSMMSSVSCEGENHSSKLDG